MVITRYYINLYVDNPGKRNAHNKESSFFTGNKPVKAELSVLTNGNIVWVGPDHGGQGLSRLLASIWYGLDSGDTVGAEVRRSSLGGLYFTTSSSTELSRCGIWWGCDGDGGVCGDLSVKYGDAEELIGWKYL